MTEEKKEEIAVIEINEEFMKKKLYEFRGCKVLLDADLAEVYGYELKAFNQQVKRNIERFQNDMMFQLSDEEVEYLRSQFVTAKQILFIICNTILHHKNSNNHFHSFLKMVYLLSSASFILS